MIKSRLSILLAEKGHRENRKITYRTVAEETPLSQGVIVRLNGDFDRVERRTMDILCEWIPCTPGDLFEYVAGEPLDAARAGEVKVTE